MINYKKLSQEEIITLAQNNDLKAMEELIKREQKNIYATFSYLTKSNENISDLTQEALFRMTKNLSSLKNIKTFKSWLNHIVTNLFYDELRKKCHKPKTISMSTNPLTENHSKNFLDTHGKPAEKAIYKELDQVIKKEILSLPEHFRIVVVLREIQGLSYEEIAKALNTNTGTIKSRISRARDKLQNELKNYI